MQHPMQRPTLRGVRLRSTRDALQIFYAVARNILPMTTRRLDAEERRAITSGDVFVWEERCANSEATGMGMERWTDGMGWGPSRVRDDFLFYQQRETDVQEDPAHPSSQWANMMRRPRAGAVAYTRAEPERLIKQTYSVHVTLPEDRPRGVTRKWHLTAYFSQTTVDSLDTIDSMPDVGDVRVPDGLFRSARASKGKREPADDPAAASSSTSTFPSAPGDPWGLDFPNGSSSRGASAGAAYPGAQASQAKFVLDPDAAGDMRLLDSPVPLGYHPHAHAHRGHAHQQQHPHSRAPSVHPPQLAHAYTYPAPPSHHAHAHHGAQYPAPLPTPAPSSATLRDPSPYSSSASSSTASSASDSSSPHTPPPSFAAPGRSASSSSSARTLRGPMRELVPLEFLQGIARPLREREDERLLRRLSATALAAPPGRPTWALDEELAWRREELVVESEERKPVVDGR
ncbi:hypothetical protein OBBRIDRAFT_885174 [Obba rivulosa]|uniref:Gti1/Pac2 family-domain-containing protein n=1 Tax=Obba rivulosa TaxID=1052685 RepID=A0A8E2DQJ7_9APHY|nr:hypothetical protein OBBRIDRAFT_885174 [Obba rivulosa]